MGISEYVKLFRPSIFALLCESKSHALGYRYHPPFRELPVCYICGRKTGSILDFVKLIPFWESSLSQIVYVCDDHGQVTDYNCLTGESVQFSPPKPYWYRAVRNFLQDHLFNITYNLRLIWFFIYGWFMWYVALYPMFWIREWKQTAKQ